MPRDFVINGETLAGVYGGAHCSGTISSGASLGLASEGIRIVPRYVHKDVVVDDFGPNIPVEVMWNLAECQIDMTLIHYDAYILDICMAESMGGVYNPAAPVNVVAPPFPGFGLPTAGRFAPAGTMLGHGRPLRSSGNHYMSLVLTSPQLGFPWRFLSCYLPEQPVVIPLSTQASIVQMRWRAIPYQPLVIGNSPDRNSPFASGKPQEMISSGAVLWDHTPG